MAKDRLRMVHKENGRLKVIHPSTEKQMKEAGFVREGSKDAPDPKTPPVKPAPPGAAKTAKTPAKKTAAKKTATKQKSSKTRKSADN